MRAIKQTLNLVSFWRTLLWVFAVASGISLAGCGSPVDAAALAETQVSVAAATAEPNVVTGDGVCIDGAGGAESATSQGRVDPSVESSTVWCTYDCPDGCHQNPGIDYGDCRDWAARRGCWSARWCRPHICC